MNSLFINGDIDLDENQGIVKEKIFDSESAYDLTDETENILPKSQNRESRQNIENHEQEQIQSLNKKRKLEETSNHEVQIDETSMKKLKQNTDNDNLRYLILNYMSIDINSDIKSYNNILSNIFVNKISVFIDKYFEKNGQNIKFFFDLIRNT
ncbi:hypothetical protein ABPG74_016076 [Tetrahymena malaccensis]